MNFKQLNHHKAWVVAVDMGYGHQRAAYPLKELAFGGRIVNANNYPGIPSGDRKIWRQSRQFYEFISRFSQVPFIGQKTFKLYDRLQAIPEFYPKRDLSKSTFQLNQMIKLIKNGWGKALIRKLERKPLPFISTFFVPAFMAEIHDYNGEIYCVICDADISRTWVPPNPAKSRINYFAPCYRVVERLKLYGVKSERIFLTGFPLPLENLGDTTNLNILKHDLAYRLYNLDPENRYISKYHEIVCGQLGLRKFPEKSDHPLTVTFAVGGAGAQRELGLEIVNSLRKEIINKKIRIILVAGIHNEINQYFKRNIRNLGLGGLLSKGIKIVFAQNKEDYFKTFNKALQTTDILWTKPSELSFYSALGLPIIMSSPIGSQEEFNRKWLLAIGAGVDQENIRYTNEWLFDWLKSGWFAEAAMEGYFEVPKYGTYNIAKIISKKVKEVKVMKPILLY